MKKLLAAFAALALAACGTTGTPPPTSPGLGLCAGAVSNALADRTAADEHAAKAVELAYKAFRSALEMGVDAGLVKGALAARAAEADNAAYGGIVLMRQAYCTANDSTFLGLAGAAQRTIADALALLKGR